MDYFSDLEFVCAGKVINRTLWNHGRVFEGYYGLQYIHRGRVLARVGDGPEESLTGPAAFFTFPGVPWHYGPPPGEEAEHCWICFQGKRVERYCQSGFLPRKTSQLGIPIRDPERFLLLMKSTLHLFQQGQENPIHHGRTVLLLEELLLEASASRYALREPSIPLHREKLLGLKEKIAAHPEQPWDFFREAERLSLSYAHFRKLFRQLCGSPPGQFLGECRLRKAESLLTTTEIRCGEVAEKCGFPDRAQFSRIFRQKNALSPTEYRKRFAGFD
ncbi:MAG: helix-turn-helix domain-containing protein [Oligosphaeraceae bacterium]